MKKLLLGVAALAILAVGCSDDKEEEPTPVKKRTENPNYEATTLDKIVKEFKFIDGVSENDVAPTAKTDLEDLVVELNKVNKYDDVAVKGETGKLGKRYVSAKGVETVQVIKKGLIGALQLHKANLSLMAGVQAQDADGRKAALDMAVKYLLGQREPQTKDEFKANGNAFGKYMMSVAKSEKYKDIDQFVYTTVEEAYANVDNKPVYMQTLLQLNGYVNTIVAFRTVHYLAEYGEKIRDDFNGENVHELSEGLGFAYALAFSYNKTTHQPYLSLDKAREVIGVNLWDEAKDNSGNSLLDKTAQEIADMFDFTVEDAK